jgi:hypothetical protein
MQIIVEALVALVLFLPGTALASSTLQDVTYRGEMDKWLVGSPAPRVTADKQVG